MKNRSHIGKLKIDLWSDNALTKFLFTLKCVILDDFYESNLDCGENFIFRLD